MGIAQSSDLEDFEDDDDLESVDLDLSDSDSLEIGFIPSKNKLAWRDVENYFEAKRLKSLLDDGFDC